jgi:hypothetical protein
MPVRKFRSVEEMARDKWREPGQPALFRAIAAVWAFGRLSRPRRFPPGVYRHRSIADLNAQTERWEAESSESPVAVRRD